MTRAAGLVERRRIFTREIERERLREGVYLFQRDGTEQTQHAGADPLAGEWQPVQTYSKLDDASTGVWRR
jgi:hypothetical protein